MFRLAARSIIRAPAHAPRIGFAYRPVRFASSLSKEDITSRVIEVIKGVEAANASSVTLASNFSKDLGLDSLDTTELIVAIEEEFDVEIPDKIADDIKTVGEVVDYIASNEDAA